MGDILVEEMGKRISTEILFKLKSAGIQTDDIDFQEIQDRNVGALQRPVANISINSGAFTKVTLTTYKQAIIVSVFLMVQELRGEYARRFMIYELVTQIAKVLLLEKLGLPLQDPLIPRSFNNVTDSKFADGGYIIYQLDFSCSFNIEKEPEEDLGLLKLIVNQYFLQDPTDDGVLDAEGRVDLVTAYGGDAYSELFIKPSVYGGRAGSDYPAAGIYGGKAGSSY